MNPLSPVKRPIARTGENTAAGRRLNCALLTGLALLVLAVYPRLAQLGGYIGMDEGSYSFISALFAQSWPSRGVYGLSLYPLLLSWSWLVGGSPMIWLRLCDLLFLLGMVCCYMRILGNECGNCFAAFWLALVFLAPMSSPQVMDAGFKNSIPAALFFFFLAWLLARGSEKPGALAWILSGACTALAVLLRESFALFAILGLLSVWLGWGWRQALVYGAGALLVTGLVLLFYHLAFYEDGGILPFLEGYLGRGQFYAHEKWRILDNFVSKRTTYALLFLLPLFTFLASWGACRRFNPSGPGKAFIFWLATIIIALVEPLTKPGFAYHLAVCLPGLGVCTAICWSKTCLFRSLLTPGAHRRPVLNAVFALAAFCPLLYSLSLLPGPGSIERTILFFRKSDPQAYAGYVTASQPLTVLEAIRSLNPEPESITGSGFSFYLFPMSGWMPPKTGYFDKDDNYRLADLGRSFKAMGEDRERMAWALRLNPPEFIALGRSSEAHETDYHAELAEIVEASGIYEHVASFPPGEKDYGFMAYELYRRKGRHS